MKKIKYFTRTELSIWLSSVLVILSAFFIFDGEKYLNMLASLIGTTALIFCAKGNPFGQVLIIIFASLYAYISLSFKYYGEMITYLVLSLPIAFMSIFTWMKNPYRKGENVVKIHVLTLKEVLIMILLATSVTIGFYFVLKALDTPNLIVSTISVATSFFAAYLLLRRNSYYALAYAVNDLILITLWVLACFEDIGYLTVVACFIMFLVNDLYAFISWKIREKEQGLK